MTEKEFWQEFLISTGRDLETKCFESFHFDLAEKSANELLNLVLIGKKKATASSLWAYEIKNESVPQVGDLSIITDWNNKPHCVIETTCVEIVAFKDITFETCKREGEDEDLISWQRNHIRFFTEEGKRLGYRFSDDMPVVFEDFKVVFRK